MNFGQAVEALKRGMRVQRDGWNGKGMFISFIEGAEQAAEFNAPVEWFNPYLTIRNVNGTISTWVPSINDVLAEDWEVMANAEFRGAEPVGGASPGTTG